MVTYSKADYGDAISKKLRKITIKYINMLMFYSEYSDCIKNETLLEPGSIKVTLDTESSLITPPQLHFSSACRALVIPNCHVHRSRLGSSEIPS